MDLVHGKPVAYPFAGLDLSCMALIERQGRSAVAASVRREPRRRRHVARVIPIKANNIDGAAKEIIGFLERTRKGDVIYLDGLYTWWQLGASAILKAVVERLRKSSSEGATRAVVAFDKIIHIDCLLWQSKRSLQKAIAEELKLPQQVMAFFEYSDEEDDFDGVEQAARGVIPHVKLAILNELSNCTFLVVFHNGSGNYVDLWEYGVPVMGVMSRKVLWTSRGRFLSNGTYVDLDNGMKELAGLSDVALSVLPLNNHSRDWDNIFRSLLHAEAEEVAWHSGLPGPNTKLVLECLLYKALRKEDNNFINWGTHAANYWVCDGIIQHGSDCGRSAWEIGDAVHRNMNLFWNAYAASDIAHELCYEQWWHSDRWVSATGQDAVAVQVTTSFFWTAATIEDGIFKDLDMNNLCALHLSNCTLSFSSPPFLSCSNLRFLLLDHCKDKNDSPDRGEEQGCIQYGDGAWFRKLWVLELCYTYWYWLLSKTMLDLMAELRELNVIGPGNWSLSHLHCCCGIGSNGRKLVKLQVVGEPKDNGNNIGDVDAHRHKKASSFPDLSSWHILKIVILDGCCELKEISYDTLPPSLESFSFTSKVATNIKSISFRRCTLLKNLLLKGLFDMLEELDMSGTSVKTLDLNEMQASRFSRLFLLRCENLCAILWPQKKGKEIELEVLCIDTNHVVRARKDKSYKMINFSLYISIRDPRLFRSLMHIRLAKCLLYVEITSIGGQRGASQARGIREHKVLTVNFQNAAGNFYIDDIISTSKDDNFDANGEVVGAARIKWMWPCPPMRKFDFYIMARCYISIEDETSSIEFLHGTTSTKQESSTTLPGFVYENAITLHLHDSLSITCITSPAAAVTRDLDWNKLEWCKLERCPNLEGSVFTIPLPLTAYDEHRDIFVYLETFSASQLLKARYIWDWSASVSRPGHSSFKHLVFLRLYYCPRLVHVLPLCTTNVDGCRRLETLEIICCGELREIFPLDSELQQENPREFPRLKHIHLYELPMLQRICGHRMFAPGLETVKIRGCWNLKRMPAVCRAPHISQTEFLNSSQWHEEEAHMPPTVDCEKDWWDNLEWEGEEASHHSSCYKPTHSSYYKKTLLRTTVLR
ncbi:unnamed protein product [Urochloa decumbens]|uniref:Disease resistance protein At4g27190-like leucine-rich repeats domain-containing protein n=1 Tax=Urochloa decumbens TaxID=240449 RepID=A0ABC9C531_9POAL